MDLLFLLLTNSVDFGLTVAIVGFAIVVFSLTVLFIVFSRLPKLVNLKFRKKSSSRKPKDTDEKRTTFPWKET